jgi:hypothetical protein
MLMQSNNERLVGRARETYNQYDRNSPTGSATEHWIQRISRKGAPLREVLIDHDHVK